MSNINGGATLWARQTIDSDIFYSKPDKWFKIWFYLVNQVNHKDTKRFKRGSCFLKYEWIMHKTKATKNEVGHCIKWLKSETMIATRKATGGFIVTVIRYNPFQTLKNYKSDSKSDSIGDTEAIQKRYRSDTIYKNGKNVIKKEKNKIQKSISESLNKKPEKEKKKPPANNIEFDFELWSWHGIDDDIKDRWAKIFPHVEVEIELINMREFFKKHPKHEQVIKDKFNDNYAIYIFDWLTRAEKWKKEDKNMKGGKINV